MNDSWIKTLNFVEHGSHVTVLKEGKFRQVDNLVVSE